MSRLEVPRGMTPREYYGAELKRLREEFVPRMTQERLGGLVFVSGGYIGQLEQAVRVPQIDLSQRIDVALDTGGALERLHSLEGFKTFSDYFEHASDHESRALTISEYAGQIVPGVLQTPEYARAMFLDAGSVWTDEQIATNVASRMERGRRIAGPDGPELWFILDEAVLRRVIGSRQIMAAQLRHMEELIKQRRLVLQVVPFAAGCHALSGLLCLMTFDDAPPLAYSESAYAGQLLDDPEMLGKCRRAYDVARATALSWRESLAFIQSIAEGYERGGNGPAGGSVAKE
ncbi:transcriptional regulator [Kitasatospora xanthocidica]|uniref:helix-turn-helix domain-containing protein n=1 Tax=Kitasatospora xanthocidica TaxID=83382 RepID=UPI00167B2A3B|nr:helix-turn-helix transcriptional regulator [Kitasatospora xanthocidica]GHF57937.1 transcriptional regulator [Kitasatospora xanthocidica]